MLVELVGCTGAGKSTVARRAVALAVASGVPPDSVILMPDSMLARAHLGDVTNEQLVNGIEDVAGLPHLVRSWREGGPFVRDSWARIRTQESSIGRRMLDMRSVARRVGMFERARRTDPGRVVLFDEGPVQSAHVVAYDARPFTPRELERFVQLVPLADVIVQITAPVEDLVARALMRPDTRRRLHHKDPEEITRLLEKATRLFDELVRSLAARTRVLTIDNGGTDRSARTAATMLAARLAEWSTSSPGRMASSTNAGGLP